MILSLVYGAGDKFDMLKLIIICGFLYFLGRWIWRILSPTVPLSHEPIELKACEYCGTLVRVDKAVIVQGRLFCCSDHAKQMR